jgi:hypothetical protein
MRPHRTEVRLERRSKKSRECLRKTYSQRQKALQLKRKLKGT